MKSNIEEGAYLNFSFPPIHRILSPFLFPHSFMKALNTWSLRRHPPWHLSPHFNKSAAWLHFAISVCSKLLLFLHSSLLQSARSLHHFWLCLAGVQHVHWWHHQGDEHLIPIRLSPDTCTHVNVWFSMTADSWAISWACTIKVFKNSNISLSIFLLGWGYIKTELKIL